MKVAQKHLLNYNYQRKLIKKLNYQSEYGPNSIFGTPSAGFGFANNDLNMFQNDQFAYPFFNSFAPSIGDNFNATPLHFAIIFL